MKTLGSIRTFLWALLLVLLAFICTGNSFKQELRLYDAQDNSLVFHSHVPDTSDVALFLPKVIKYCTWGMWGLFRTANFQTYYTLLGSVNTPIFYCNNFTTASYVKSLRHMGANDTDTDALSLYDEDDYSGKEIFVTARARTEITNKILGIAGTGTSDWMLFEGQDLDGKSKCYTVPFPGYWYMNFDYVSDLNLTTIGSVFKGCDAQEIQNYKKLHKTSSVNSN